MWLRNSKLIIVAGKGGVGKTTVSAVTVAVAARLGMKVLLVTIDDGQQALNLLRSHLGDSQKVTANGGEDTLGYEPIALSELVEARQITPDQALIEWLSDKGLRRLADRLVKTGALDVISTAAPGIRDILVLGRIKALVNEGRYDLIVLDGPASGHAITFLGSAHGLIESVQVGAIHQQAKDVVGLLADPALTQCVLVTLPEATPVNELIESAFALEDRIGIKLAAMVVNSVLDPVTLSLDEKAESHRTARQLIEYRRAREAAQQAEINRLAAELPLPLITLPSVSFDSSSVGFTTLVDRLYASVTNAETVDQ